MIRNLLIISAFLLPLASAAAPASAEESHNCTVASQATGDGTRARSDDSCSETHALKEETRVDEAMRSHDDRSGTDDQENNED
jgi:hypothetical protein